MVNKTVLVEELKKHFGFDTFKGNQEAIITSLLDGHDTFVLMPTRRRQIALLPASVNADGGNCHCNLAVDSIDEEPG